ncbi:hypothetical protein [Nonomuraea turcica]|uniref:hypothetical protein n=1 Tax=Nonomuraea sp. G32 TaxID=3067274 RepID=UPI00273CE78B|nr:hypothetical protein [Nonomuraea sp. G32]MDP4511029.1 hypothetical protein [Nonomuraea sp. G32]
MATLVFYSVLWLLGANDEIEATFHISLNATTHAGRILMIAGPALAYLVTYRICRGLQRADAELVRHGTPIGVIKRLPDGAFVEAHAPLTEDAEAHLRAKGTRARDTRSQRLQHPAGGHARPLGRLRARTSETYGGEKVPIEEEHDPSLTR